MKFNQKLKKLEHFGKWNFFEEIEHIENETQNYFI